MKVYDIVSLMGKNQNVNIYENGNSVFVGSVKQLSFDLMSVEVTGLWMLSSPYRNCICINI